MNKISISHKHSFAKSTAWSKAEDLLDGLSKDYNLDIETDGEGNITFSGSGITGDVEICSDYVTINAQLSFLMIAMKPIISSEIQKKLDEKFS